MIVKLILILLVLCALIPLSANGQKLTKEKFVDKQFVVSSSVYWAGVFANIKTQGDHKEWGGPAQCRMVSEPRHIGSTLLISGGAYGASLFLQKKHHHKAANMIRYFGGGANFGMIGYNERAPTLPVRPFFCY